MMAPIAACSIVGVAVFVRKLLDLPGRLDDARWLERATASAREGDLPAAVDACAAATHPAARAVGAAFEVAERRPDRVEAEAARVGSRAVQEAERQLGLLSFIAQVAPLLGLLGTVVGMVQLFWGLEAAGAASAAVSGGIWKALLTTAAGLAVAVPALAAHAYLSSRADHLRVDIHDAVERALTALPSRDA